MVVSRHEFLGKRAVARATAVALAVLVHLCEVRSAVAASLPDVRRDAAVIAIDKVMPSVVNIATETLIQYHDWYGELLQHFYGYGRLPMRQETRMALGSGVLIDDEGYVLTNFHVVRRANRIQVKLWDGREYDADPLVATETSDIALLKLRAKPGDKFKGIKFAPDDDLLLGETVMAVGNPYGLGGSVTKGILSSKNRRPSNGSEPLNVEDWLQTDAAINPGNSGGPLVNLRGELIGLNVAVYRGEEGERGSGVGFSIPVKQISAALAKFFTPEVTDSLWFGAQVKSDAGGLVVESVRPGSPAARAGLRERDRVVQVNDQPVAGLVAYNRLLTSSPQHNAALLVDRNGAQRKLSVQLQPFDELIRQKLGLTLLEITSQTAERLGVRAGEALFVDEVEKNGPAARGQVERGFLVAALDGENASKLGTVTEILAGKKAGDTVRLSVIVPRRLGARYVEFRRGTVDLEVR
jgi:S1-C subfamily serine protease